MDDRGLYADGQIWLDEDDVVGRARGLLPFVGMITIYMNEYPNFKVIDLLSQTNNQLNISFFVCIFLVCYSGYLGVLRITAP